VDADVVTIINTIMSMATAAAVVTVTNSLLG